MSDDLDDIAIDEAEAQDGWEAGMRDENRRQRQGIHRALDLHEMGDDAGAFEALYRLVHRTPRARAPGSLTPSPVLEAAARICDARADEWRNRARSDLTMPVQLCASHEHEARWLAQAIRGWAPAAANSKAGAK